MSLRKSTACCASNILHKIAFMYTRGGNGSVVWSWVKWVIIFGWVTWVMGHCQWPMSLPSHSIKYYYRSWRLNFNLRSFALKTERVVQYYHGMPPPSPMRKMKWCNVHGSCGSWVTNDDPFPSLMHTVTLVGVLYIDEIHDNDCCRTTNINSPPRVGSSDGAWTLGCTVIHVDYSSPTVTVIGKPRQVLAVRVSEHATLIGRSVQRNVVQR